MIYYRVLIWENITALFKSSVRTQNKGETKGTFPTGK